MVSWSPSKPVLKLRSAFADAWRVRFPRYAFKIAGGHLVAAVAWALPSSACKRAGPERPASTIGPLATSTPECLHVRRRPRD